MFRSAPLASLIAFLKLSQMFTFADELTRLTKIERNFEQTFAFHLKIDKILTDAHNWSESVSLIISNREMHYATILDASRAAA